MDNILLSRATVNYFYRIGATIEEISEIFNIPYEDVVASLEYYGYFNKREVAEWIACKQLNLN